MALLSEMISSLMGLTKIQYSAFSGCYSGMPEREDIRPQSPVRTPSGPSSPVPNAPAGVPINNERGHARQVASDAPQSGLSALAVPIVSRADAKVAA